MSNSVQLVHDLILNLLIKNPRSATDRIRIFPQQENQSQTYEIQFSISSYNKYKDINY